MLTPVLAACVAFHVGSPQVYGPYFADEIAVVQKAVSARVGKLPNHCKAQDAQRWVALAGEGRTRPDGPVCAAPARVFDLLEPREIELISPLLDDGELSFDVGELRFKVPLVYAAPRSWPARVARAKGFKPPAGWGLRGLGGEGSPMGVAVELFEGWKDHPGPVDREAISAALAPCRDQGEARDVHRDINYAVVLALDAQGAVTRAEHQAANRGHDLRAVGDTAACVLERIRGLRFPPGAQRAVVLVNDRAPEPIPRTAKPLLNFEVDSSVGLISRSPFYDEPRFHRCVLPLGETPFTLKLDETGRVLEAQVPGLEGEGRTCAEDALRHVAFTCPEGGPTTVEGRMVVR